MGFLGEALLLLLFKVPGSFFRWLINKILGRQKKSLRYYIENGDVYLDGIIGMAVVALIVLFVKKSMIE